MRGYDHWKTTEPDTGLPQRCTVCGTLMEEPCSPATCPREQPEPLRCIDCGADLPAGDLTLCRACEEKHLTAPTKDCA